MAARIVPGVVAGTHGYRYRIYSYRPGPSQSGYRHHYVIHHPRYPKHCYFYNPVRRVYWGRCAVGQVGTGQYSLLAEADRKGDLNEIPESAFPAPGPMPIVPGAEDDLRLDPPPPICRPAPIRGEPASPVGESLRKRTVPRPRREDHGVPPLARRWRPEAPACPPVLARYHSVQRSRLAGFLVARAA